MFVNIFFFIYKFNRFQDITIVMKQDKRLTMTLNCLMSTKQDRSRIVHASDVRVTYVITKQH